MKILSIFSVLAILALASIAVAVFVPEPLEAAGPWFQTIYVRGTAYINGPISLNATYAMGQDAFSGADTTDTVTITGAAATDKYVITMYGAAYADTISQVMVQPTSTGFILRRSSATAEANQAYTWLRSK